MYLIPALLFAFIIAALDGTASSLAGNIIIIGIGMLYTFRVDKRWRKDSQKLLSIAYVIYITLAFVYSQEFLNGNFFYSGDSVRYISFYINSQDVSFDFSRLTQYYVDSEGKDILYHELLKVVCGCGNVLWGGCTVYFMTLIQTLFGVLASVTLFEILSRLYGRNAYKYALLFSVFSYFLLYSCFIVRDIIIAYLFLEATRIVLGKFKLTNVIILLLLIILTIGIRLQSGLFLVVFLALYLYNSAEKTKYKNTAKFIIVIIMLIAIVASLSSVLYENSLEGLAEHQEETNERQKEIGGLYNMFFKLPFGIQQIAILFFSQIAPFPPYGVLVEANNAIQVIIGIHVMICEFFWFIVSYSLIISLFNKEARRCFSKSDYFLLGIAVMLLLLLTVHPDVRRMIPVYPIIYLSYIKVAESVPKRITSNYRLGLIAIYFFLLIVYFAIKGV